MKMEGGALEKDRSCGGKTLKLERSLDPHPTQGDAAKREKYIIQQYLLEFKKYGWQASNV